MEGEAWYENFFESLLSFHNIYANISNLTTQKIKDKIVLLKIGIHIQNFFC